MPDELLSDRVERLEKTVEGIQSLPAKVAELGDRVGRVETQIVQLRAEMRVEFSDVRSEMRTGFAAVRSEMQTESATVRSEMEKRFAGARDDLLVGLANVTNELRHEIRESAEEGKRHSQILFEEVLSRIAALGEHREESSARKPRAPRRKR